MISHIQARARVFASLMLLLAACGGYLASPVLAATPYREMSATEGDPGDGVLRPSIDPRGDITGDLSKLPGLVETTSSTAPTSTLRLPAGDTILVPVYLPGSGAGPGTFIFLPRSWSHLFAQRLIRDGRWHHVP